MPKWPSWFYAAWALAVVLAVYLPFAVPSYAAWPRGDDSACVPYAKNEVVTQRNLWAVPRGSLRASVLECSTEERPPAYRAEITLHGPYGIPLQKYRVNSGEKTVEKYTYAWGWAAAATAVLAGAVMVSIPFALYSRRYLSISREQSPSA